MSADIPTDGKGNYVYRILETNIANYDGDTFSLTIQKKWDFGFGIHITQQFDIKTRIIGIDTPELRDKRPDYKAAGYLAKRMAAEWVAKIKEPKFHSLDHLGKFGRPLGDIENPETGQMLTEYLLALRLAVPYHAENKEKVQSMHEANIAHLKAIGWIE